MIGLEGYTFRAAPTPYSKAAWHGRWRRNDWPAGEWVTVESESGFIMYASTSAALTAAYDAAGVHAVRHGWQHVGIIEYGALAYHVWSLTNEQGVGYQVTRIAGETATPPTGTGRYMRIEALLARFGSSARLVLDPPKQWREPTYPGDSVRIVRMKRPDQEHGEIRVQDYMGAMRATTGSYKVGMFLPGIVECSPGDTPKVWPERHEYAYTVERANAIFDQYYLTALTAGWRPA